MKWLTKQLKESDSLFDGSLVALGVGLGIVFGLIYSAFFTPIVEEAHAEILEVKEQPKVVMIEVVYTEDSIIRRIKEAFPEDPQTAVAIARCESGLDADIQSQYTQSYGREMSFGLFQIHAPAWDKKAHALGYTKYRSDVNDNIAMARYIYEQSGKRWSAWSCYTKGMI